MEAVDYVVKPFSPAEIAARIRTALRRRAGPHPAHLRRIEPFIGPGDTFGYAGTT